VDDVHDHEGERLDVWGEPGGTPAERIDGGDFILRRPSLSDAEEISASVLADLDRLADWMPWAVPDQATVAAQRRRLKDVNEDWDRRYGFEYLVTDAGTGRHLGNFGLHDRVGPGVLEIGYWLVEDATGRGIATRAVRLLTEAGLALPGIDRIEIHVDEANLPSQAVPRRLGFRQDRVETAPANARAETGRLTVWTYPPALAPSSLPSP
jgi:RimJ/RimL family protein N-acetyltransferase